MVGAGTNDDPGAIPLRAEDSVAKADGFEGVTSVALREYSTRIDAARDQLPPHDLRLRRAVAPPSSGGEEPDVGASAAPLQRARDPVLQNPARSTIRRDTRPENDDIVRHEQPQTCSLWCSRPAAAVTMGMLMDAASDTRRQQSVSFKVARRLARGETDAEPDHHAAEDGRPPAAYGVWTTRHAPEQVWTPGTCARMPGVWRRGMRHPRRG
jgi:hypothetical protein